MTSQKIDPRLEGFTNGTIENYLEEDPKYKMLKGEVSLTTCLKFIGISDIKKFNVKDLNSLIITPDKKTEIICKDVEGGGAKFNRKSLKKLAFSINIPENFPGTVKGTYIVENFFEQLEIPVMGSVIQSNTTEISSDEEEKHPFLYNVSLVVDKRFFNYYKTINQIVLKIVKVFILEKIIVNDDKQPFFLLNNPDSRKVDDDSFNACQKSKATQLNSHIHGLGINKDKAICEKYWLFYPEKAGENIGSIPIILEKAIQPRNMFFRFQIMLNDVKKRWNKDKKIFDWINPKDQESLYLCTKTSILYHNKFNIVKPVMRSNMTKAELNELFKTGTVYCTYLKVDMSISETHGISTRLSDNSCKSFQIGSEWKNLKRNVMIESNKSFEEQVTDTVTFAASLGFFDGNDSNDIETTTITNINPADLY